VKSAIINKIKELEKLRKQEHDRPAIRIQLEVPRETILPDHSEEEYSNIIEIDLG